MTILNFRIFLSLSLIFLMGASGLAFFLRKKPISKMINLAFLYISNITFLLYMIVIKNLEDALFPIFIILFIDFLMTFATGIGILNNLLNNKTEKNEFD